MITMKLSGKSHQHIGIWGFGTMGKSAARFLHAQGYQLAVMDKRLPTTHEQQLLQEKNIVWYNENEQDTFFNSCDFVIPSPGINIRDLCYATHREKLVSELDFFYHNFSKPIIAVTGSIGKTSITHILAQLFKAVSIPVAVGGNIGIPTFDLLERQHSVDYALVEVSSFQLMHCLHFAPTIAIWTNFYSNHLDYHASDDEYFAAKCNLLKYQHNTSLSLVPFALRSKIPAPSAHHKRAYFSVDMPHKTQLNLQNDESLYYIHNNVIMRYEHNVALPLMTITESLLHLSFIDNVVLLVGVCDLMQLNPYALQSIATITELPAHRLEKIGTINNITFYNDSKGTTTVSTLAAIEKLKDRPLHLFLGGLSKGVDRAPFIAQLKNQVKYIYCFGKEAQVLHAICTNNNIPATQHTSLNSAVDTCITKIESGDCVLLSPAGSSFDLYENYEHRGNHFKELVQQFINSSHLP